MTSQAERTRAYAELASYIARLKREKAERQNAETQGDAGNHYHSPPHRKLGSSSHGSAHYHPYQRPQAIGKNAAESRDANDIESLLKQLTNDGISEQPSNNGVSKKRSIEDMSEKPKVKKALLKQLSNNAAPNRDGHQTEPKNLCPTFIVTGISTKRYFRRIPFCLCAPNPRLGRCSRKVCPHIHDPDKQAVCKRWFYKDTCQMGKLCFLSHVATPRNTPTCTYFMAGRCSNNDCRFAHVRVDPAALNCKKFGRLGYCEKGDTCTELHAHECPYYANQGFCYHGDNCRMGHYHRASRMKASRFPSPASPLASNTSDRSNTPEDDMDVAGVNLEQNMPKTDAHQQAHQFTQQADFVSLDDDP
ncbi:transcription initiation factor tfiid subunit 7 [Curvularia clavata]|uniref:Transcription initiation factor tfiid subunit 7 n=1 Tax=Curvularia clavata TaxID=95742 RepID=A0A9Q9DSV3_CURCL|nr:transcription initiation factor tfiid subunit 7 [Curvularia clavata]